MEGSGGATYVATVATVATKPNLELIRSWEHEHKNIIKTWTRILQFIQVVSNTEHVSRKHENSTSSFKLPELFFWHVILWRNSLNFFQLSSLPKCYANLHECTSKQTHGNPDPENPLNKSTQRSMKHPWKHPWNSWKFSKHPIISHLSPWKLRSAWRPAAVSSEVSGASSGTSKKASPDLRDGSLIDGSVWDVFGEKLREQMVKKWEKMVKNHQLTNEIQ